nr:hypothetical protein [Tanacetum cinerariifolium]
VLIYHLLPGCFDAPGDAPGGFDSPPASPPELDIHIAL